VAETRVVVVGVEASGLVVASCLAGPSRPVLAVEPDRARLAALRQGRLPFFEPGLEPLFREALGCGWLELVADPPLEAALWCVATDPRRQPWADSLVARLAPGSVLALQAPVPVGTAQWLQDRLRERRGEGFPAGVVSNPLLLRRGQAVRDFLRPRWVLLGGDQRWAVDAVAELYRGTGALLVRTDHRTAEAAAQMADALPGVFASLLEAARERAEAWGADFELLSRLVLSEAVEGAFRRYVHGLGHGPARARDRALTRDGQVASGTR